MNYCKRSVPLCELLAKDTPFNWTDRQENSFCDIRDALCSPPVLGYPDRSKPLGIILDVCATGLGYILVNVNKDGSETPLFYGGQSTTRAEKNYCATELELAALLSAVKAYQSYISNSEFEIVTDHVSLTYIQNLRFGTSKLVRASLLLNQFRYKIVHLAGKKNSAADGISRTDQLQTDPLTEHEANRFQPDSATDLKLDMANTDSDDKAYTDMGTQCELLKMIKTFNENNVWPVMNITDWNMQPPLPQRRAHMRSANRASERTPRRSSSGQVPVGECTPGSSVGAAAEYTAQSGSPGPMCSDSAGSRLPRSADAAGKRSAVNGAGPASSDSTGAAASVREAAECIADSEGPGPSHSESTCSGASLPALACQPGLQTDVSIASSTAARSADRTDTQTGTVSPGRTRTPAVQVNSPWVEIAGAADDTPTGPTD